MNPLIETILIGLAGWRCAALISYERGPFDIFLIFRKFIGFKHNSKGVPIIWEDGFLTNMISCPWCLGLWVSLLMFGLWQISQAAIIVIAASSILIMVEKWNRPS